MKIHWTNNTGPYRKLLPLLKERWSENDDVWFKAGTIHKGALRHQGSKETGRTFFEE